MSAESNRVIKGYELRERIGAGGFGEVYRAYQPTIDREVAIKIIVPQHANQAEFIRNFENEARIIARLEHPYIVPLFDFWRDPSGAYLIMRWLRGGSLTERLQKGALSLAETQRVTQQISQALATAHQNKIVHRDLKPDNVLLDEEGNVYLTDFGIASVIGATQTNDNISGSIQYISPEQLMSQTPSARMDIYSYGMMLYEMLTGEYAYHDSNPSQIIHNHLHEPVPFINDPNIPDEINKIIRTATAKDPVERYADIRDIDHALKQIIEPTSPLTISKETSAVLTNPYKGLNAFDFSDVEDFFGRDRLVSDLLSRLKQDTLLYRFLAVIGPSGSGKSSVVRAGLMPRLWDGAVAESNNWFYTDMIPGEDPIAQLEAALLSVAVNPPTHLNEMLTSNSAGLLWVVDRILTDKTSELVLFIDQFEEVFTLVQDETIREQFLQLLHIAITAEDSRIRVIITMRADFTDRPLLYADFGELIRNRSELIVPLKPAEIEQAITGPANRVGLQVDSDLVATIVSEIREEPGALPLLQFVLTELYERRNGNQMTLSAYQQLGGVRGALAMRAEEVYQQLDARYHPITRQIFLRLIALGEGTEDTRRRVLQSEVFTVSSDKDMIRSVIEQFSQQRLLTTDRDPINRAPTLEVAHEALIREWDTLRQWLDVSREDVRLQRMLLNVAQEWEAADRDASFLLRGGRLATFEEWIDGSSVAVADLERDLLHASITHRDQLAQKEIQRIEHERQLQQSNQRRLRLLVVGAMGAAAIGFILMFLVILQSQSAIASADEAGTQAAVAATSENLAVTNAEEAQRQANIALTQIAIAETAQFDVEIEANRAQTQVALVSTAEADANQNAVLAANNAGTADTNALDALNNALTATIAQGESLVQANNAQTQVALVSTAESNAINNALTATFAQGEAIVEANNAGTQAAIAATAGQDAFEQAELAATSEADAVNNALTATVAQGESLVQANLAQTQVALVSTAEADAVSNAELAAYNAGTADANALDALNNALTATIAQGEALAQANLAETQIAIAETAQFNVLLESTNVKIQADLAATAENEAVIEANNAQTQVALVSTAQSDANTNAIIAENNALTAAANEVVAENNAATAVSALEISEVSERLARAQALASSADQLLAIGNTDLALPLAIEAANLNPNLIQAQSVINRVADVSPILVVKNVMRGFVETTDVTGLSLVDRETGKETQITDEVIAWNENAIFSPDSRYLVTVGDDYALYLWELSTRTLIHRMSGHLDRINQVIFTPDGRHIISASDDSSAVIWGVESGHEVHRLVGHEKPVVAVAVSSDSNFVATGGSTPAIIMWDIATGEALWQSPETGRASDKLQFSPDDNTIYSWWNNFDDYSFERWNPSNGRLISIVEKPIYRGFNRDHSIAWTGGFRLLQTAAGRRYAPNRGNLTLWNPENGTLIREIVNGFDWRIDNIRFLDFSPDGSSILVGVESYTDAFVDSTNGLALDSLNGLIKLRLVHININSGEVLNRFETSAFPDIINDAIFMSDNRTVLSTTTDNSLILWDVQLGESLQTIGVSDLPMNLIDLSKDGQFALTRSPGDIMRVWATSSGTNSEVQRIAYEDIGKIAFSPDDQNIYAQVGSDIVVLDRDTGNQIRRIYPGNSINNLDFSPTEPRALASINIHWVEDRELAEWEYDSNGNVVSDPRINDTGGQLVELDLESAQVTRTYGTLENSVYSAHYDNTGNNALVDFEMWDLIRWSSSQSQTLEPPPIREVDMNLASFNIRWGDHGWTNHNQLNLNPPEVGENSLAIKVVIDAEVREDIAILLSYYVIPEFSDLGPTVDENGIIRTPLNPVIEASSRVSLMSLNSGEELIVFDDFSSIPTSIVLSPDETMLAISLASPENSVLLMDVASGQLIRRFVGHTAKINEVAFSPDGLTALSASDDRTLILWNVSTGQIIRQFTGHAEAVTHVVFSKDGRSALSTDGTEIIEWRIETLDDILARVQETRDIQPLNCIQREQYNVRPLCNDNSDLIVQPSPTVVPTSFLRVEVLVNAANVRAAPETSATIVTSLNQGDIVDILEITPEWYKIILNDGQEGWISRQLVIRK